MGIELGPFLCKPTTTSMGFWVLLEDTSENPHVEITISQSGKKIDSIALGIDGSSNYGHAIATTSKPLTPGSKYSYSILLDGKQYIPPGLTGNDLWFKTLPEEGASKPFDFVLMSCNGVDDYEKEHGPEKRFLMWERLNQHLNDVSNENVYLGILGGDQVYMDRDFRKIMRLSQKRDKSGARKLIRSVYYRFWSDPSFRRVMAKLPCLLMWDDHDLMDGFGSRLDQFDKHQDQETPRWQNYRKELTDAFYDYQSSRNPELTPKHSKNFSFSMSWDDIFFSVLDLRSERHAFKKRLLSETSKRKVSQDAQIAQEKSAKHFFFITPVTIARMGEGIEQLLGEAANYLWGSVRWLGYGSAFWSRLFRSLFWLLLMSVAIVCLHAPTKTHLDFLPAVGAAFLGLLIAIADWLRARLETRSGKPIEVVEGLSGRIPINDWPIRLWIRLFGWALFFLGSLVAVASHWADHGLSKSIETTTETLLTDPNLRQVYSFLGLMLFSVTAGSYLSTHPKSKRLEKALKYVLWILSIVAITWLEMPGTGLGLYIFGQLLAQIPVILYMWMAHLESWGILYEVAGLDDDVKDAWSSAENRGELKWLYELFRKIMKVSNNQVYVLSGDIHTGGITKLFLPKSAKPLYQVVSSPISYPPMPGIVERFTGSDRPIRVPLEDGSFAEGINYFYNCSRNFAIIRSISEAESRTFKVEFEFENLDSKIEHRLDL